MARRPESRPKDGQVRRPGPDGLSGAAALAGAPRDPAPGQAGATTDPRADRGQGELFGDVAAPPAPGLATLDGTLERVVYSDESSHFTVARFAPDDPQPVEGGGGTVNVVGTLYGLREGTALRLLGAWQNHPRHGRQFRVDSYRAKLPETLVGIERYLASGVLPGVGQELAKRLVEHFGVSTLDVIASAPQRLAEVHGIGQARVKKIAAQWRDERGVQDVMVFLHSYGVSGARANRILARYGHDAMALIRKNPYRLALDVWGIGFKTADAIARNLGLESTAPERLEAGLVHVLGQLAEDGHVHAPESLWLDTAAEILAVERELLPAMADRLLASELIVREVLGERGPCVSLRAMWQAESEAAAAFGAILAARAQPLDVELARVLGEFERQVGIELAPAQRRAIAAAQAEKCVVITGGPGVGKTTIVRAIVSLLARRKRKFALAAPTGRAAKRLAESTGHEAATLHRLLEFQPQTGEFARNADDPLDIDALIVDEVSMVDIELFRVLCDAVPPAAQLVLVGDVDQLPSVGPGAVLADIIASAAVTVVRLTEIFRQARESHIITAAHEINRGVVPRLAAPPGSDAHRSDFYFIQRDDPVAVRDTLVTLVAERIPARFGYAALADIQVLTPVHRGELGTLSLNQALQERLNPAVTGMPTITRGSRSFRIGDKVMQVKNDYTKSVFNGDIGLLSHIASDGESVQVVFSDDRTLRYERDELDQLIHAFAVSVHKSQGSEYPAVVLPLVTQHYIMLQRNLLYTAVTRGKKLVVIVGSRRAMEIATRNQSTRTRFTWLAERIRQVHGANRL